MNASTEAQRQALRLQLAAQRQRLCQLLNADSAGVFPRSLSMRLLGALPADRVKLLPALVMLFGPRALRSFSLLLILARLLRMLAAGVSRQPPASTRRKRLS